MSVSEVVCDQAATPQTGTLFRIVLARPVPVIDRSPVPVLLARGSQPIRVLAMGWPRMDAETWLSMLHETDPLAAIIAS